MSKKAPAPSVRPVADRLVGVSELVGVLGIHRSTIWRMVADKKVPALSYFATDLRLAIDDH
jgi:hypothetical protein